MVQPEDVEQFSARASQAPRTQPPRPVAQPAPPPMQPPQQQQQQQAALLQQVLNLTQEQIDTLPPNERQQIMALRNSLSQQLGNR